MRQWSHRLGWLESILTTRPLLVDIARTKVQQFAAEAGLFSFRQRVANQA